MLGARDEFAIDLDGNPPTLDLKQVEQTLDGRAVGNLPGLAVNAYLHAFCSFSAFSSPSIISLRPRSIKARSPGLPPQEILSLRRLLC